MDEFSERLFARAATIDELLSESSETGLGQAVDATLAEQRLAAWCQSAANGDQDLFRRRLSRDGFTYEVVKQKFAAVRRGVPDHAAAWVEDAIWIEAALQGPSAEQAQPIPGIEARAFDRLLLPVVEQAETRLWASAAAHRRVRFTEAGRLSLRLMLLDQLSDLCAPVLYERFTTRRLYDPFVTEMQSGGFRHLFEDKPVLLRLIARLVRQWIDSIAEFAVRIDADMDAIRSELVGRSEPAGIARIEGGLSDRHNGGRSVLIVTFEDGTRAVYKPKDLRLDTAWHDLISRLNRSTPPLELRAVRAIARDHYGWTEFIEHTGCPDETGFDLFFRRAGAWLALFHCFAATDIHQENVIAAGDHPIPIDLETILQPPPAAPNAQETEPSASDAAADLIASSVMAVGILPAYGRAPDTSVFAMGALTADWNSKVRITWIDVNTDAMRPTRTTLVDRSNPNLPHVAGRYASFSDHVDALVCGFEDYARFLSRLTREPDLGRLFDGFAGAPIRKVVRPTRFYSMLLQRLKAARAMNDGAIWSAQADFIARMSDWNEASDANWPFLRAERSALLDLNVPHFVLPSDGHAINDFKGPVATLKGRSGLEHARERVRGFDDHEISWQIEVIRANTTSTKPNSTDAARLILKSDAVDANVNTIFASEADRIAADISDYAIRRGNSAAWIGLDWMGDAESFQLTPLGPDLYNGVSGIAVFLAAHSAVTRYAPSGDLALAALTNLRRKLKDRNAGRFARSLGIGGATGLGSLVYALSVISKSLGDETVLADAHAASALMTDELIAADKRLDALGGSAGAILGLLRLYRDTQAGDVLARAVKCGEHLLRQDRVGPEGLRSWVGHGLGQNALNGMSHGAAGFAYALASLASVTGRDDFHAAAAESLAFENSTYDAERHNWPDRRHADKPGWACRWCHGAPGIGLARAGLLERGAMDAATLRADIQGALTGVEQAWPTEIDTLCCGTLGSVEFIHEAGEALGRPDVRWVAAQRLSAVVQAARAAGDYRWNAGKRRFNLGLFRGLAGVGYTLLRQRDDTLPNILIWE